MNGERSPGDSGEPKRYDSEERRRAIAQHLERLGIAPELAAIRELIEAGHADPPGEIPPEAQKDEKTADENRRKERERRERRAKEFRKQRERGGRAWGEN